MDAAHQAARSHETALIALAIVNSNPYRKGAPITLSQLDVWSEPEQPAAIEIPFRMLLPALASIAAPKAPR